MAIIRIMIVIVMIIIIMTIMMLITVMTASAFPRHSHQGDSQTLFEIPLLRSGVMGWETT